MAVPVITSLVNNYGPTSGGNIVLIRGQGFNINPLAAGSVKFGSLDVSPLDILSHSGTEIEVKAPAANVDGEVYVVIQNTEPGYERSNNIPEAKYTYIYDTPTITDISPTYGPTAGGTNVIITGERFHYNAKVLFGSAPAASVIAISERRLDVVTPPGSEGSVRVYVQNADGKTGYKDFGFYYETPIPPESFIVITSLSPDVGPVEGGTPVTVKGQFPYLNLLVRVGADFDGVGGAAATSVVRVDNETLTFITPTSTVGAKSLWIGRNSPDFFAGYKASAFTYIVPPPLITSVAPAAVPLTGGAITIEGNYFVSGAGIKVGDTLATGVTFHSKTKLTCTAPPGSAGAKDVVVTNPDNQTGMLEDGILYLAPPSIADFSPKIGTTGTSVTITGSNLDGAAVAFYNDKPASIIESSSDEIAVSVPDGTETGTITLTTGGGVATTTENFIFTLAPVIEDPTTYFITFKNTGDTYHTLELPVLPPRADGWRLFGNDDVLIAGELEGESDFIRSDLLPGTRYVYYLRAYNAAGLSTPTEPDSIITNLTPGGGIEPPNRPDAPAATKDCLGAQIIVSDSEWEATDTQPISGAGLRRRVNGGAVEELNPDWDSPGGSYPDASLLSFDSAEYSVNRRNGAGEGEWSDWSEPVILISSTEAEFMHPAPGTQPLHGKVRVRIQSSTPLTSTALSWNGVQIGEPILAGGFYVLDWATYESGQGAGALRFQAVGEDGCLAFAEVELTVNNSIARQTAYADIICRENVAPDGYQIKSALLRYEARPMPAAAWRRMFLRAVAYLDDKSALDPFGLEFSETTWADGQALLFERGRRMPDGTQQFHWNDVLGKKSDGGKSRLIFRLRWDAQFVLTGHSTLGEGSEIVKFQEIDVKTGSGDSQKTEQNILLLSLKTDGSAAAIYQYDLASVSLLKTGGGEEIRLENYGASDASDFALAGDKLWFKGSAHDLFYIDMDAGDASGNMLPRGEERPLVSVENISGGLCAVFCDPGLPSEQTKAWLWNGSWRLAWALDDVINATKTTENGLALSAENRLYHAGSSGDPELIHEFESDISALHERFIGLENGKLFELRELQGQGEEWTERLNRSAPITAITETSFHSGVIDELRGVAGERSQTLLESTSDPAIWSDGRALSAPALMEEELDHVTALHRVASEREAVGQEGLGYKAKEYSEVLMIGTAPDGLLLTLEQSPLAKDLLAVETTQAGSIYALPIVEKIPEKEEEL